MNLCRNEDSYNTQEARVCKLLRKNFELDEIARIMHISLHTVKSHVAKIKRMNVN